MARYNELFEGLMLSAAHRQELEKKRGFTPETIARCGFKTSKEHPDRILIPFYNGDDIVYYREHKFGPKDVDLPLYIPPGTKFKNHVILTESEYKAAALSQMQFPAVGLQGISTFAKKNFPKLQEFITVNKISKVVILFDNDDNATKGTKHYKPDPGDRWDVQYYEFRMAWQINKIDEGIECRIARLPDSCTRGKNSNR